MAKYVLKGTSDMPKVEYLLDANIVIKLWKSCPELLDKMEQSAVVDYKLTKNIAGELSTKEYRNYNGIPILTEKFMKLLEHIIEIDEEIYEDNHGIEADVRYDSRKNIYYINDNKLSDNDFSLIAFCNKHDGYILVTEDKKIYQSAKYVLGNSRVLSFAEFMQELNKKLE